MGWKINAGIVLASGSLIAAVAVPNFVSRQGSCTNACIANLKQIQGAMEQYALENKLEATNQVSVTAISGGADKYIRPLINVGLVCPKGGTYSITTFGETPTCSVPGHTI